MSKETKETGITSLPIVKKIMHLLKMDDDGQINKFFEREIKRFKNDIKVLENNRSMTIMERDTAIERDKNAIEDAVQTFEDAKLDIKVEDVKNNAAIDDFRAKYWNNILRRKEDIRQLELRLAKTEDNYKQEIEAIEKDIAERQELIDMITK